MKKRSDIWELVYSIHDDVKVLSPEDLWFYALQYFNWNKQNPLLEGQVIKYPLRHEVVAVPKTRPLSLPMFFVHSGVSDDIWSELEGRPEYKRVCQIIKSIIYDQKFSGAAAGLLREALITRDLGLADKVDHTSSDGSMSPKQVDPSLVENLARKLTGD